MNFQEDLLTPIFESSQMPVLVEKANKRLKDEQRLREKFYNTIGEDDKWEFINGKIIKHLPAKEKHTIARKNLEYILETFVSEFDDGQINSETSLVVFTRNDYIPDLMYFDVEKLKEITAETFKYPVPNFIIEVLSKGTAATDRGIKKMDYAKHGVQEYWIVDTDKQYIEQYILSKQEEEFTLHGKKQISDNIDCQVIKNCSFPVKAIFDLATRKQVVRNWIK